MARAALSRLRWGLERRLAAPLIAALLKQSNRARMAMAAGLGATAIAAVAVGVLVVSGGEPSDSRAEPVRAADLTGAGAPELEGVAPDFRPKGDESAQPPAKPVSTDSGGASPQAISNARRFAGAFLDYEVGRNGKAVADTLTETSTPALGRALKHRPPRLPSDGKVPRARLLNVLAGPRRKREVEVSVAIMRLGAASELRLTMSRANSGWLVSEVRG